MPTSVPKELGKKIKKYREGKLTQIELSAAVNVSPNYISAIEQGVRRPSLKLLEKIARVLKIPVKDFF